MFTWAKRIRCDLLPEGDRWLLVEPVTFVWVRNGLEVRETIPAGFTTDFGSIPFFYRWRFSPTSKGAPAFLAHDYLYYLAEHPRDVCDRVMLDGLDACKVNWWDRHVIYRAVRLGGGGAYGKRKREEAVA
jgi:hypothetical protein